MTAIVKKVSADAERRARLRVVVLAMPLAVTLTASEVERLVDALMVADRVA